jgi:hypothetical protein
MTFSMKILIQWNLPSVIQLIRFSPSFLRLPYSVFLMSFDTPDREESWNIAILVRFWRLADKEYCLNARLEVWSCRKSRTLDMSVDYIDRIGLLETVSRTLVIVR